MLPAVVLATPQKRHRTGKSTGEGSQLVRDVVCFLRAGYKDLDSLAWKRDDHGENPQTLNEWFGEGEKGTSSQGRTMKL